MGQVSEYSAIMIKKSSMKNTQKQDNVKRKT